MCLGVVVAVLGLGCAAETVPMDGRGMATSSQTDPGTPVPAADPRQRDWGFPDSTATTGAGACTGTTVGGFLDSIRRAFPEVRDIQSFRSTGPRGAPASAGAPVRAGEQPPPSTGTSEYVTALMDDRSFGAIFFRGNRCRADLCEEREYWYFDSDAACGPQRAGHHRVVEQAGGRLGTCFEVFGEPLWNVPGSTDARHRCDADWSPQDISGTVRAWSLTAGPTCGKTEAIVPVDLTIIQDLDPASASIVVSGTGISSLDGRAFRGKVERRRFTASLDETSAGNCPAKRQFTFNIDFEGPSINGIPGGFGLVDVTEQTIAACPNPAPGCSASLHLVRAN
jgi:hypothetical protein